MRRHTFRIVQATSEIPIIFVTASPNYREFEKRNIKHYIKKPFDLDELLAMAATVVATNS